MQEVLLQILSGVPWSLGKLPTLCHANSLTLQENDSKKHEKNRRVTRFLFDNKNSWDPEPDFPLKSAA